MVNARTRKRFQDSMMSFFDSAKPKQEEKQEGIAEQAEKLLGPITDPNDPVKNIVRSLSSFFDQAKQSSLSVEETRPPRVAIPNPTVTEGVPKVQSLSPTFVDALKEVENSVEAGKKRGMWFPHDSPEGGTPTIAWGHKLTEEEAEGGFVNVGGERVSLDRGLTDEQAEALLQQDIARTQANARSKMGDELWDSLPQRYKAVVSNIAFNVGTFDPAKWPKLMAAMKAEDDATVRKEMTTTFFDPSSRKRVRLESRAERIANAVGLANGS